ncbi:MAG TPA: ATP citrate lyase citrate-binding domain-containing protein [Patescibacteria group bacterium]
MLLTEAEGKALLQKADLDIPHGQLLEKATFNPADLSSLTYPVFIKAQVLHGNRALQGLVKKADSAEAAQAMVESFFETTDKVLVEEAAVIEQELYLSIKYDTRTRTPVVLFSAAGGAGMDERGETMTSVPLSISQPLMEFEPYPELTSTLNKLFQVFKDNDATLVEVNPLAKTPQGFVCLDAKVELEDVAAFRHEEWVQYGERGSVGRPWTEREEKAHAVSHQDHRGVAGESFFEFPGGEIGVMASGGGASALLMDAMLAEGLKPANYTEYSGNPTREKVKGLTKVVLSIPNLKGLYVAGSNAAFTDIYETLGGLVDGFLETDYAKQPGFPVLIRRGGPRWEEAFEVVKERLEPLGIKLKLFGPEFPLVKTISEMKKLLKQ